MNNEHDSLTPLAPHVFVIFGATGDLNRRKLLPALYKISIEDDTPDFAILGASRRKMTDRDFAKLVSEALQEFAGVSKVEAEAWMKGKIHFQTLKTGAQDPFEVLIDRVKTLNSKHGFPQNTVYYLSLPPQVFPIVIRGLGERGANDTSGWTRLVIEKPFGNDLKSARELNELTHRYFNEEQVYRIDHYLGKETVQNLLAFRFANGLFEPIWNRDRVERVEITVAESLGVEDRADYYDKSGALRDMIQNHLTQLLTVIAMDAPTSFNVEAIRAEKLKVLKAIAPIKIEDLVYGQYTRGEGKNSHLRAYVDEENISSDSTTETYAAVRLAINNWRWQGVPFYLRTGKRMKQKLTEIAIVFERAPISLFSEVKTSEEEIENDVIKINISPKQSVEICFNVKKPGKGMTLQRQSFNFDYDKVFGHLPDAYTALLFNVMEGDRTLFVGADEAEASWELYDPILSLKPELHLYTGGSWGPKAANRFVSAWETGGGKKRKSVFKAKHIK